MPPKNRFNSLDVVREVRELREKLVGMRLANLYDVDKKTYLLKFAKSDEKLYLVIESGNRIHMTQFSLEHTEVPNVFAVRLRKLIRTKRLEEIRQYGMDRVVDFVFGVGQGQYHLIVELYAAGNIILADCNFKILIILRSYKQDDTEVTVGTTFNLDSTQKIPVVSTEQITEYLKAGEPKKSVKNILSNQIPYGAPLIEHCLREINIDPNQKVIDFDIAKIPDLVASLKAAADIINSSQIQKGWIVCKKLDKKDVEKSSQPPSQKQKKQKKTEDQTQHQEQSKEQPGKEEEVVKNTESSPPSGSKEEGDTSTKSEIPNVEDDGLIYEDFIPILYKQNESSILKEFPSFDTTVDHYFSKFYAQKVEQARVEHESIMDKQLEKVKHDQATRIKSLDNEVQKWNKHAELIQQNVDVVDQCIAAVNASLSNRLDWDQLNDYIKEERSNGNPLALMIHKLKLEKGQISILLYPQYVDDDEQTEAATVVDIDISMGAHANARTHYEKKKKAVEKKDKTVVAADKALKSAEEKAKRKMKEVKVQSSVRQLRKPYWFEKFNWFISSENFIIVGGRDVQQNELLYKRYLQKGDLYFHADIFGASTVILKNPEGGDVPPLTLQQAATFSMCHSNAWKSKVVTSAYYVHDHQVSKTAPSGEYLTTGSFMIRGKKNFLPPSNLAMGLGLLFRVSDECIANHVEERKARNLEVQTDNEEYEEEEVETKKPKSSKPDPNRDHSNNDESISFTEPADFGKNTNTNFTTSTTTTTTSTIKGNDEKKNEKEDENDEKDGNYEKEEDEEKKDQENSDSDDIDLDLASSEYSVSLVRNSLTTSQSVENKEEIVEDDEEEGEDDEGEEEPKEIAEKDNEEDSQQDSQQESQLQQKKGLSIKEKKLLQKQKRQQPQQQQSAKQKGPVPKQLPRGQRARQKKKQEKYGWQDEEDRKIAMSLLGHAAEGENISKKQEEANKKVAEIKKETEKKRDFLNKRKEIDKEEEEIRLLLKDEKIDNLTEEEKKKLEDITSQGLGVNLASLTGKPLPNDILLYAIPVCGPFSAMKDYKYKVKVTPGNEKKGTAIKTASNLFLRVESATEKEKELIKSLTDQEWGLALISNCKISAPGVASIKNKNKGKNKKKK